jgi:hypothetical protein
MDLTYINTPNEQRSISSADIDRMKETHFIEMDDQGRTLAFGPRAAPLLRPPPQIQVIHDPSSALGVADISMDAAPANIHPSSNIRKLSHYPGFISFLGDTGAGKSWILRSLLRAFPHYPAPLSSPGKAANVVASTSSDINLYADGATSSSDSPILFLDFEGLNGTDLPCTYTPRQHLPPEDLKALVANRQHYVETVYPRLAYAFSDCIVFVTTNTMQSREAITALIASFVNAAHGSRYQSFKPALVIVYNKFANDDPDWSEQASTIAFLEPASSSGGEVNKLQNYFDPVRTIKIPSSQGKFGHIAIAQLDELEKLLREEFRSARNRRVQCYMNFESRELMSHLWKALRIYSDPDDQAPVFDWVTATQVDEALVLDSVTATLKFSPLVSSSESFRVDALVSFWRYCLDSREINGHTESFKIAWIAFTIHLDFFVRLYVHRQVDSGNLYRHDLASDVVIFQSTVAELEVPCSAKLGSERCGGTRGRHRPYLHESAQNTRWIGRYKPIMKLERLADSIPSKDKDYDILTVLDFPAKGVFCGYLAGATCAGCLFLPVAPTSCHHPFCETCIQEIVKSDRPLHCLPTARCLSCPCGKIFSLRFLPDSTGYRLLQLFAKRLSEVEPRGTCLRRPILNTTSLSKSRFRS